jgi:hypothetical protein
VHFPGIATFGTIPMTLAKDSVSNAVSGAAFHGLALFWSDLWRLIERSDALPFNR